jgi:hypothetical protein
MPGTKTHTNNNSKASNDQCLTSSSESREVKLLKGTTWSETMQNGAALVSYKFN